MATEPLPDGFLKLADELSRRASSETDPAVKARLLESADKLRSVDQRARTVLSDVGALTTADPSRLETSFAWLWLGIRTLVGIVGALIFLGIPAGVVVLKGIDLRDSSLLATLVISSLLGVLCLWVGFAGWSRNPQRDLQLRKSRKQRYGWPL